MTERIIDISERPANLSVRYDNLIIEVEGQEPASVPLAEMAALIVSHPHMRYSHAVLCGLAAHGVAFVACDERHLPAAMLLPVQAHFVQAERFALQAAASAPLKKSLWRQIVKAKVSAQARLLRRLYGQDFGLARLALSVRSGDSTNVEARAARRYWPALFADPSFQRLPDAEDQNRHLNYGYAVLRAAVARALCGCGLHPSLGIHHHNRYDAFCLADDLMEPFRPLVDAVVVRLVQERGRDAPLDRQAKAALLEALTGRLELEGESRALFDVVARTAASLAAVFEGKSRKLLIPEL